MQAQCVRVAAINSSRGCHGKNIVRENARGLFSNKEGAARELNIPLSIIEKIASKERGPQKSGGQKLKLPNITEQRRSVIGLKKKSGYGVIQTIEQKFAKERNATPYDTPTELV